jgi:hypothetical protein
VRPMIIHAAKSGENGKLVRGEQYMFGMTVCGKSEDRLADFADEVTCLRCLKALGRTRPAARAIVLRRIENGRA